MQNLSKTMNTKTTFGFLLILSVCFFVRIKKNIPNFFSVNSPYQDSPEIVAGVKLIQRNHLVDFSSSPMLSMDQNPWLFQQILFQVWPSKQIPKSKILLKIKNEELNECKVIDQENEVELVSCK